MKKIISIFSIFLVFILGLSFVNANLYWSQEANANYDLGLGTRFTAYGSNHLNPISDLIGTDYSLCSITKSDYTPIVSDFGQTGELKVVVTDTGTNKLSIYNSDCSLFQEINVGSSIDAMPVLLRPKSYFDQQIIVLTDGYLKSYEYSFELGYFVLVGTTELYARSLVTYYYLTCFDFVFDSESNSECIAIGVYIGDSYVSNCNMDNFSVISSITGSIAHDSYLEQFDYSGLSNIRNVIDDEQFYVPLGFFSLHTTDYYGYLLNRTGSSLAVYDGGHSFSDQDDTFKESSDFIAKIGNNYRLFSYRLTGISTENKSFSSVFINDLSGNNLFYSASTEVCSPFDMDNISYKRYSNWAVADYDMDGSNEACFLVKLANDEIWLQCYENTLSESDGDIRVNYTGLINDTGNFILADFVPSKDVLGIATKEGIFYPGDKVYSTGKTADFGFPITTINSIYAQTPMYVYTDDDEGFIVYADVGIDSCGNGDCEYWETPLSCCDYDDCLIGNSTRCDCCYFPPDVDYEGEYREGSPCKTDADCADGLKCEYGVCTKLTGGAECTQDSDCLSGECLNGYCTKASWWKMFVASKNQMMGDDVDTNNFLSLFFILAIAGFLGYYGNVWMGISSFYVLGIFFAIVGWLSVFILFGLIITGIIAIVFKLSISGEG